MRMHSASDSWWILRSSTLLTTIFFSRTALLAVQSHLRVDLSVILSQAVRTGH